MINFIAGQLEWEPLHSEFDVVSIGDFSLIFCTNKCFNYEGRKNGKNGDSKETNILNY
jgi:hypothetical protein